MNSTKLKDWLTLVANVAVVSGIVFLAIEIRQNNELRRSQSRQTLVANDVTSLVANLAHLDVFEKLISNGELSAND